MRTVDQYLTLNYHKIVTRDEDGDYVVEVQELPGCAADGSTPNEAFTNLIEAMRSWIESRMAAGLEIPTPRDEEYSGKLLLRMPKFLHRRLAQQAETEGTSLNQYVIALLSDASARAQERMMMVETQPLKTIRYTMGRADDACNWFVGGSQQDTRDIILKAKPAQLGAGDICNSPIFDQTILLQPKR